ncbi:neurofilament medium polypeptide [Crotalus adamanteus]|uniref:Neurofilament medium polypeptide n=1 Tax=Crotalus adamanteus TaxID=8729 RepID=A0AAW1B6I3_CROAD
MLCYSLLFYWLFDSEHLEEDIQRLKERFEDKACLRDAADAITRTLRKDMDEASLVKVKLDKKVQSLLNAFLHGNHDEDLLHWGADSPLCNNCVLPVWRELLIISPGRPV